MKSTDFNYYLSYVNAVSMQCKTLSFYFSLFKASINHLSIEFATLEILFSYLAFQKNLLSSMSEKQGSAFSKSYRPAGSIIES